MSAEMQDLSERVRACHDAPTDANRRLVYEALESKWEGVQSVALQVLGEWGDVEARQRLREFLERAQDRPYGWSIRGVAVRALASCVRAEDAEWVLDRLFSLQGVLPKHELLPVVLALPPEAARPRLLHESQSSEGDNRQAAMKALGNMPFDDRDTLLAPS